MKVLFLDFDGVLNDLEGRRSSVAKWNWIDPRHVEQVNRIVERTGCQVVVSSSWRKENRVTPRSHLNGILHAAGARFNVLDVTPFSARHDGRCNGEHFRHECERGHEIQAWIDRYTADGKTSVEEFAIVDDSADMAHLMPRLVRTNDATGGLLDAHVERICLMLGEKESA